MSLVVGRARRVTFYCTWWPSALTTRPHGQVTFTPFVLSEIFTEFG